MSVDTGDGWLLRWHVTPSEVVGSFGVSGGRGGR